MTTVFIGEEAIGLDDRDLLGEGGEGRVYRAGDRAIKVFLAPSAERRSKLLAFPAQLPPRVVGPLALCTDRRGAVIGFAMRRLDGAIDAHRLGQRKWREAAMRTADVLRVLRDVAGTVGELHARGVVVASDRGPPDASAVLASLRGKCLAGGAVMCATDDGLVLVRADRASRTFVPVRSFSDARDLVAPDDELLLGPGGSLFSVRHDEIAHLSFCETT